jgi:voltage-gated potassium channel
MSPIIDPPPDRQLAPSTLARLRMLGSRWYRFSRMALWFPHFPLTLAVGLVGLSQLLPSLGGLEQFATVPTVYLDNLQNLGASYNSLAIRGVPTGLIGGLLIVMSVGLLFRSRLAWTLVLLMTMAVVVLQTLPDNVFHPWLFGFDSGLLIALLLSRREFQRSSLATATLFALVGMLVALGYGVMGAYIFGAQFVPPIRDFGTAFYYTVTTMSTVGYGDIIPHTPEARWFAVSLIIFGLVVFATSLTALVGPLMNQYLLTLLQPRKKQMNRKEHIVVIGDTPLARNTIKAMTERGLHVTAIWMERPSEGSESPVDLIIGDGADTDILRSADVSTARAVLALGEDDSDNAFVVLATKEVNERVQTVVSVSDAHNLSRVRRVHPDVILALPLLGSELLAMALSGEKIDADALVAQIFNAMDFPSEPGPSDPAPDKPPAQPHSDTPPAGPSA